MIQEKLIVMRTGDDLYADESSNQYSERLKDVKKIYKDVFILSTPEDKTFYWIGKIVYYFFLFIGLITASAIAVRPIYKLITQ